MISYCTILWLHACWFKSCCHVANRFRACVAFSELCLIVTCIMAVERVFPLLLVLLNFVTDLRHLHSTRYPEWFGNTTGHSHSKDKAISTANTTCLHSFNISILNQRRHLVRPPKKNAYLCTRIIYYSGSTASFQLHCLALCGDINPNPGPCVNSSYRQHANTSRSRLNLDQLIADQEILLILRS